MGTTTRGFRFMDAGDFLATVHTRIKNLADDVDAKTGVFFSDIVNVTPLVTGTGVSAVLNFPLGRFAAAPHVVATPYLTSNPQNFAVSVLAVSTSSCTIVATRLASTTTTLPVMVIAHY